jgi:hypothetical protein
MKLTVVPLDRLNTYTVHGHSRHFQLAETSLDECPEGKGWIATGPIYEDDRVVGVNWKREIKPESEADDTAHIVA